MTSLANGTGQRLLKRGGACNRADRASWQLTRQHCEDLLGASAAAARAGRPLNRFITVAWGKAGLAPQDSVTATGEFIRLAREWHRARGHPMPWCWVQEHGPVFRAHCHLLLHVPAELEPLFRPMPTRWAKKVLAGRYVAGVMRSERLASAYAREGLAGTYRAELLGKLHYMMKCAPAALEGPLGMTGMGYKDWGQSCPVLGKRAGTWQGWKSVGPAPPVSAGENGQIAI